MQSPTTPDTLNRTSVAGRRMLSRSSRSTLLARLILISMALIYLLPFYWMVATALKSTDELGLYPPTLFPHSFDWSVFSQAVNYIPFFQYLQNTVVITLLTVVASVISNPIIAYGFSRIQWPGRDKVFYLVLATVFLPYPVLIVGQFDIFAKLKWINTPLPLVVPFLFGNAFWIFLLRQFLLQISPEIQEAARIDGANEFQTAWHVILPLAKPGIAAIAIFSGVYAWNDFLGPLLYLQEQSKYTLAIGLTFFRSERDIQFNLLMAASALVVLPVVVLFLVFQRYFIEGLTVGSVKG